MFTCSTRAFKEKTEASEVQELQVASDANLELLSVLHTCYDFICTYVTHKINKKIIYNY